MIPLYDQIYQLVRTIPAGKVATYGQIAKTLGNRRLARQVGYALAALAESSDVPWHRVVNAKGQISKRSMCSRECDQRARLIQEGVEFDPVGSIELLRFQHAFVGTSSLSRQLLDNVDSHTF